MRKIKWAILFIFLSILFFTSPAHAIDFSINEAKIDAYLQTNGDVRVEETFNYEFDDDFNGITRELIPKKGAEITNFAAFENGSDLKVEKDKHLYKIHRPGENEAVTIDIRYTIKGGMEKYEDGAQFYWPFFDKRNESDYEKMTITIHPPRKTGDVLALGYDAAYKTEHILSGGAVQFQLGFVPESTNGDIRVIYDADLFQAMETKAGKIRPEIMEEQQRLADKEKQFLERKTLLQKLSYFLLPLMGAGVLTILLPAWITEMRRKKLFQDRLDQQSFFVPDEKISLPAAVLFTNSQSENAKIYGAVFYDLINKGRVKKTGEDSFTVQNWDTDYEHEKLLLDFLFNEVGNGTEFQLSELESFTKDEEQNEIFEEFEQQWITTVDREIKQEKLYKNRNGFRAAVGLLAVLPIAMAVFYGIHQLHISMAVMIIAASVLILFAFFYIPKTDKGLAIEMEWKFFQKALRNLDADDWNRLSKQEKERTVIYGLVFGDEFKDILRPFTEAKRHSGSEPLTAANHFYMFYPAFHQAHLHSESHWGGSGSSSSFSGGGVGGGGGGSGAF